MMTEHVARKWGSTRKLLLRLTGLVAAAATIACGVICAAQIRAQVQAVDATVKLPAFDVVSIKQPDPSNDMVPSLLTALQEQLGLRIESRKVTVDTIFIDHIEQPSAN